MPSVTFFVPGKPAPQGSKRFLGNGRMVESSGRVYGWRVDVRTIAQQYFREPLEALPIGVALMFVMPRPTSTPKRRAVQAVKRPDVDKLTRAVLDAMTCVAWKDDSQVVELHAFKRLAEPGEQTGVWVRVSSESMACDSVWNCRVGDVVGESWSW